MPSHVYTRPFFKPTMGRCQPVFVVAPKRYKYKSPKHIRHGRNSKQRTFTSPTYTFWFCGLLRHRQQAKEAFQQLHGQGPDAPVFCESAVDIPDFAQSKGKDSALAIFRAAFNTFSRTRQLGKLCLEWILCGTCSCSAIKKGAFVHPKPGDINLVEIHEFLQANRIPADAKWKVREEFRHLVSTEPSAHLS